MATEKKELIFKKNGQKRPYFVAGQNVNLGDKENPEFLPDRLAEMQQSIKEAKESGYAPPDSGIPKKDLSQSVQDTLDSVADKVDKEQGKGLSSNDYTDADKAKVDNLKSVATSGSYNDLTDKPNIPPTSEVDPALSDTSENAVQNKVVKAAIDSLRNALDTLIGSGNVQGAIDTFNEVKAFLEGIDTSDPKLFNQLKSLSDAISALQNTLSTKANTADVANTYATKRELTSGLFDKQDKLTFDDAPTAGSNNAVKSGGIKTAIDNSTPTISQNGKWVIGGIETDVDARGPRGNTTLINENAQGIQALIVNNVVDGGETDILSAEMGKVIRIAIMTIFNALSPYAFTNGKPIISWGSTAIKHDISVNGVTGGLTISDIYVDGDSVQSMPAQILDNKSLSFKLNLPNDVYIFNGVAITMGGIDITENSGVWDETTGIVTIANVTGAVVVVATAASYIQDSLVFNLDCRQGVTLDANDVPTKWTDQKGNIEFDLTDVTQNSEGALVFNGSSSKGIAASGSLVAPFDNCTVEIIGTIQRPQSAGDNMPILANNNGGSAAAGFGRTGSQYNCPYFAVAASPLTGVSTNPYNTAFYFDNAIIAVAATKSDVLINGVLMQDPWHHTPEGSTMRLDVNDYTAGKSDLLSIGYRVHSATPAEKFFNGTIMAIRIHTRKLSVAEMQTNYALDKKRFNLQ